MPDIYNILLADILPSNLLKDEKVKAAAEVIDSELAKITGILPRMTLVYSLSDLPEEWIDELAWQNHVDFYDSTLPIDQKIALVDNALQQHMQKGTPAAVEGLVTTVFGSGDVEEWWQYGGLPYHFRVKTTNPAATNEQAQEFIRAVNSVKRLTAILDDVLLIMTDDMNLYYGGVLYMGDHLTIEQVV